MTKERISYTLFVAVVVVLVILAAVPIIASDLFREPYSSLWPTINRALARLQINYNPSGGGVAPQFPPWRDPADANLFFQSMTLITEDDVDLAGWYVPSLVPDAPSVVLCHGLFDSKWSMLRLVPWLHDAGYNVLLFDFRGQGQSQERPATIGPKEALDVEAALDWLDANGSGGRVGGLGMSLGAAALVNAAVDGNRLDALVLDSLFAVWNEVNYAQDYRLPPDWLVPGVPSPVDLLPEIHVPVFLIHGTADILVHVDHAYRNFEAANEPKQLWINDSGHAWGAWTYPDEYQKRVLGFFGEALQWDGR